jgi:hypothetical protein
MVLRTLVSDWITLNDFCSRRLGSTGSRTRFRDAAVRLPGSETPTARHHSHHLLFDRRGIPPSRGREERVLLSPTGLFFGAIQRFDYPGLRAGGHQDDGAGSHKINEPLAVLLIGKTFLHALGRGSVSRAVGYERFVEVEQDDRPRRIDALLLQDRPSASNHDSRSASAACTHPPLPTAIRNEVTSSTGQWRRSMAAISPVAGP